MAKAFGDSLAVGFGRGLGGVRRVGASPAEVYLQLQRALSSDPKAFQNQPIYLSTGVSNNPDDFDSIRNQFNLLKNSGAVPFIIGASKTRYGQQNQKLAELANQFNFKFLGPITPGPDQIHPASYDLAAYAGVPDINSPIVATQPATQTAFTPNQIGVGDVVLAKNQGVEGILNKATNAFTTQNWTDEEEQRYNKFLAAKNAAQQFKDSQAATAAAQ